MHSLSGGHDAFIARVLRTMDRTHAVSKASRNPIRSRSPHGARPAPNHRVSRFARLYLGRVARHLNPRMMTEPWAVEALAKAWRELEAKWN
jgi:hypothetical protein